MNQSFQNPVLMNEGDDEDLRVLLIGKAGSGKSATGNTIFNDSVFESKISPSPVTKTCQTHTDTVNNRRVTVIDTPDFITSTHTDELKRALELCSPGAHVILLILPLRTFTAQEKDVVSRFEQKFGVEALRYTLVLFTRAESRQLEALIRGNNQLSGFINRCGGGICGMNNKDRANIWQVTELMEKINKLVSENTNSCYTLEMMKDTERRQEEEERREEKRREREHQMTLDTVKIETETRVKREFEEQERAKRLEKQEIIRKKEKSPFLQKMKNCVFVFVVFAVMTGGVSFWKKDHLHRWPLMRGFLTAGSAAAAGVFTGSFCRLMWKSQFVRMCSSSHERPSAVRQLLLKAAGVVCGGVFAGAVIDFHFVGENLLVSVLAGAAGAFTAIHWSS